MRLSDLVDKEGWYAEEKYREQFTWMLLAPRLPRILPAPAVNASVRGYIDTAIRTSKKKTRTFEIIFD